MIHTESKWNRIRSNLLARPDLAERYARQRRAFARMRAMVEDLDAARAKAGVSKAELARRTGVDAASLRRLFTSDASNPTLLRFLEVADALGIEVRLAPAREARADVVLVGGSTRESTRRRG